MTSDKKIDELNEKASNSEEPISSSIIQDNLVQTVVRLLGDKTTISEIVQLLAYIRYAIQNNQQADIKLSIGKNVSNTQFAFDVNYQEIPNLILKENVSIN